MKVSLKWLSEYVDVPSDVKAFCDRLDVTGTGVEGVAQTGAQFNKVICGKVLSKVPHPDSDHMFVTTIDVGAYHTDEQGNAQPLQVVCGAQNFNEGDHVVTALCGAILPGDFAIKKAKKRGVWSFGMNCSRSELGLPPREGEDGIMILPDGAPVGVPFAEYAGLADTILDLEITPNRPDCLSMLGMAREVGAMYKRNVFTPLFDVEEDSALTPAPKQVNVEIASPDRAKRYTARVIEGVKIAPSPDWLAERVISAGTRSINNVVDVTNYIMYLFGQPLHAFDFSKISDDQGVAHLCVRAAHDGETFETLDGEMRQLTDDMTVISSSRGIAALAGVMGGADTEITDQTTKIVLEAAAFNSSHTSRTSRNLGLMSEASLRFERIVDDNPVGDICDFAAALMAQVTGGHVAPGRVDVYHDATQECCVPFRIKRFESMMGLHITADEVIDTLERLGCSCTPRSVDAATSATGVTSADAATSADVLDVVCPTFRPDLTREIDLYEEVLRLVGMDSITPTLPAGEGRLAVRTPEQQLSRKLGEVLRSCGLCETMTYSFADPSDNEKLHMNVGVEPLRLLNPINAEQSILRESIIPGLLHSVAYNQNHGVDNIQLYEIGEVFRARPGHKKPYETLKVAGVLAGCMTEKAWNKPALAFDFFDGKGVLETLFCALNIPGVTFVPVNVDESPFLHPGCAADVFFGKTKLGWVGQIHPRGLRALDVQGSVIAFELDFKALLCAAQTHREYCDVPVYPGVSMDIALVVDEDVSYQSVLQALLSAGGKLLVRAHLFDVYRNEQHVGAHKKSLAFSLLYRSPEKTLSSEEVAKIHARLVKKVCAQLQAEVRD